MTTILKRLQQARQDGDHALLEELLFANSSEVIDALEAARFARDRVPWSTHDASVAYERLHKTLDPFEKESP